LQEIKIRALPGFFKIYADKLNRRKTGLILIHMTRSAFANFILENIFQFFYRLRWALNFVTKSKISTKFVACHPKPWRRVVGVIGLF
jgi:hypothetical protein